MKKKFLTLLICICMCFGLLGCSVPHASQTSNEWKAQEVNNNDIYEFIDPDTGVHYWIYSRTGGYAGMGGITPRLNSDGTVMITE
mgnify:CR=1 FL=1